MKQENRRLIEREIKQKANADICWEEQNKLIQLVIDLSLPFLSLFCVACL